MKIKEVAFIIVWLMGLSKCPKHIIGNYLMSVCSTAITFSSKNAKEKMKNLISYL